MSELTSRIEEVLADHQDLSYNNIKPGYPSESGDTPYDKARDIWYNQMDSTDRTKMLKKMKKYRSQSVRLAACMNFIQEYLLE